MRKIFLILFCWSCVCSAQEVPERIQINLGTIASNEVVAKEFPFAQKIRSVVGMCECVKATLHARGKWSIVRVEFDPKTYSGDVMQEVIVVDVNNNVTHIDLKAHVMRVP